MFCPGSSENPIYEWELPTLQGTGRGSRDNLLL